jgi:hypothetical protein
VLLFILHEFLGFQLELELNDLVVLIADYLFLGLDDYFTVVLFLFQRHNLFVPFPHF